jgi:SHS2 domain-containing protein
VDEQRKSKTSVEFLDHTGDIGMRLSAPDLPTLFKTALFSMFEIICPRQRAGGDTSVRVSVCGDDLEQLLVNWLSEFNYLFQTEAFMPGDVPSISVKGLTAEACVSGETVDPETHRLHTEIKAITYHQIYVKRRGAVWQARVIFDI